MSERVTKLLITKGMKIFNLARHVDPREVKPLVQSKHSDKPFKSLSAGFTILHAELTTCMSYSVEENRMTRLDPRLQ